MFGSLIDSAIGLLSPQWAAQRTHWRAYSDRIKAKSADHQFMRKMMGGGRYGGYEAGKVNRLTRHVSGSAHENDLPRTQIDNLRWRSWNLYRNNPQARKICRTLGAKVIGRGLNPQPQMAPSTCQPAGSVRNRMVRCHCAVGRSEPSQITIAMDGVPVEVSPSLIAAVAAEIKREGVEPAKSRVKWHLRCPICYGNYGGVAS